MKLLGMALIAFGLIDLVGSYADFDLWGGFLSIQLPETIWSISSFIEIGAGYYIFSLANKETEPQQNNYPMLTARVLVGEFKLFHHSRPELTKRQKQSLPQHDIAQKNNS